MADVPDPRVMRGTQLARDILGNVALRAARFEKKTGRKPCLAAVLVGDEPGSVTYVRMKRKRCADAGIDSRLQALSAQTTTDELVSTVAGLSADPRVDGILLQDPVPPHIDERAGFEAIAPAKDVDGVTMHSFATMAFGRPGFDSCTPGGIMKLLDAYGVVHRPSHASWPGHRRPSRPCAAHSRPSQPPNDYRTSRSPGSGSARRSKGQLARCAPS